MPPIHSMTDDVTTAAEAIARRKAMQAKFFPTRSINQEEVAALRLELNRKHAEIERQKGIIRSQSETIENQAKIQSELRQRVQYFEANDCLQNLDLHTIRKSVCKAFDSSLAVIMQRTRMAETVKMKHIAMFLCRKLSSKSLPEIGRFFGGMDHTSVLNGVRRAQPVWDSLPKESGLTVLEMAMNMRAAWDGIYGSTSAYNRKHSSHSQPKAVSS